MRRNLDCGAELGVAFDKVGVNHKQVASIEIAVWAYRRSCDSKGMAWVRGDMLVPGDRRWLEVLGEVGGA